tara:strand:- start:51931 stop:54528 length:2598 start_codon:yes stop_codon:yes gene_type:complete
MIVSFAELAVHLSRMADAELPSRWRAYVILIPVAAIVMATIWTTRRVWQHTAARDAAQTAAQDAAQTAAQGEVVRDRKRLTLFVLGSVAAALVSIRVPLHVTSVGVDGSFPAVLNHLAFSSTVFGRDVIYTYGPLGWLLAAEQVNDHLLLACLFWIAMYACVSSLVVACSVCFATGARRIVALLCSLCVLWLVDVERLLPSFGFLLAVIAYQLPRHRLAILLFGSLLAALALLTKFSGGVTCGVTFVGSAMLPFGRSWVARLLALAAGFGTSLAAMWLLIYGSLSGSVDYFLRSMQISSGYTASMAAGRVDEGLLLGMFALAIAAVFVLGGTLRGQRAHAVLILVGPMFIAWKHAVVRFDTHILGLAVTSLFLGLTWVLTSLIVGVSARSFALRVGVLVLLGVLLNHAMAPLVGRTQLELAASIGRAEDPPAPLPFYIPLMSCRAGHAYSEGVFALAALAVDWRGCNDRMRTAGASNVAPFRLPDAARAAIGTGSVDFYSMDLSFVAANELDYRSKPVFQHFNAFTPELDRWNAEFFRRDSGPQFLICHASLGMASIDRRHLLFDDPLAQLAILDHYEGNEPSRIASPASVLLRRTDTLRFGSAVRVAEQTVRIGEVMPVAATADEGILRARIELVGSLVQNLKQALLRLSPLYLTYTLANGRVETYRLMPLHLQDGVWVEPYFPTVSNYYAFMARENYESMAVESVCITAGNTADYPETLNVVWELIPERQPGLRNLLAEVPMPIGDASPALLVGSVEMSLPAMSDPVDSVAVKLSTYQRVSSGPIQLQMLDADSHVMAQATIDAAEVEDNGYNRFRFEDTAGLVGKVGKLRLIYATGSQNHIAYWPFSNGTPGFDCKVFHRVR